MIHNFLLICYSLPCSTLAMWRKLCITGGGGGGGQLRIRKSLKLYIVLYRNTMKNIKISLNKIWYTYTALIPTKMMFSLLNKCTFLFKCVSWTHDQNTGEECMVYRYMSFLSSDMNPRECRFTNGTCAALGTEYQDGCHTKVCRMEGNSIGFKYSEFEMHSFIVVVIIDLSNLFNVSGLRP